jgi:hypothetical protein
MSELGEVEQQQLTLWGESIKEQFDEVFSVDLKSKKGNGPSIFCIGRTKLYFVQLTKGKTQLLLDCPIPLLSAILSGKSDEVGLETKVHGRVDLHTSKANDIIHALRQKIFMEMYPGMDEKENAQIVVKVPEDRLNDLTKVDRPCGNYKAAYLAECEASGTPVREDIAFDVEHLFSSNNVKEFNLEEFEGPLSTNDIKCLLGALRYNPYFTALKMRNHKLEKEQAMAMLACLRSNRAIESVSLGGLQANKDFYVELFKELGSNKQCAVRELNLSDNKEFGDTGSTALSNWISALPHGVSVLDLSNCAMRGKGIATICGAFKKNAQVNTTLTRLDLSQNRFEAEGSSALAAFLAQPNALTQLYLRDCGATLDLILGALNRGTSREIRELDISANKVTPKSTHLSVFVRSSSTITKLNVSATGFTAEMLKELLASIKSNPYLQSIELIASKNAFGLAGARVIMDEGGDMTNITSLDISENDFDDESMIAVCHGLARAVSVKKLDLSRNMPSKGRSRDLAIEGLINLITSPDSALEHFTFCGGKGTQLGPDMLRLIDAMGDAIISGLDITGHAIGNKGASSLGKMLQSNHTLHSLVWDENGTTLVGFKNFRKGLKRNSSLKSMSLPILDIEAALSKESDKPGFLKVIRDLEACIVNNNSPKSKFKAKEARGGNEFLFFSTSQREALEKQIVKLKSKGKKPSEDDQIAIKDAENFETVIGDLHIAKADTLAELEVALKAKLQSIAEELSPLLAQHLMGLKRKMLDIIKNGYASLDEDTVRRIGTGISFGTREVDVKELQDVMVVAAGADIAVRSQESYQSAVDIASDYCFEKLEENLIQITERLQNEVEEAKLKPKKVKKHKKDKSDSIGLVKDGSSGSLATTSSASSKTKDKTRSKPVVEESDDETAATSANDGGDGAATPDDGEIEEAAEVEEVAEEEETVDDATTQDDATAEDDATEPESGTATPPTESADDGAVRTHSQPSLLAAPSGGLNQMGGSGPISVAPKKMPPALPKSGPPPTPKFKLPGMMGPAVPGGPPPAALAGGTSGGPPASGPPSTPGEAKFAPKGPPPKVPMGFPPKVPVVGPVPAGGAPPTPVVAGAVGKVAALQMKLGTPGGPPPGTAPGTPGKGPGPLRPAGVAPPIPMVLPGVKKVGAAPATPVTAAPSAPASSSKDEKDKSKDKTKEDKDKPKDKKKTEAPKSSSKTPTKTSSKPTSAGGKKKDGDKDATFISNVTSQGAASGLSAASTQAAPEGALDNMTQATGGPMVDPRANRAGGAARRRPPTRRPQGPSAV